MLTHEFKFLYNPSIGELAAAGLSVIFGDKYLKDCKYPTREQTRAKTEQWDKIHERMSPSEAKKKRLEGNSEAV